MPRILLFTGKGGVGKTSVAAATALRAAERGTRTLVISTDAAHSLGDVFDQSVGPEPVPLTETLHAQEIDIYYSVEKQWGKLQEYVHTLFRWRGVDEVFAEEMSVLPGMEEAAGFLWVHQHYNSGNYELIVIDSAPTGETLRFLSLPDVGRWWMEKLFPIQRRVARVLRPAVETVSNIPLPQEDTYNAAEQLFKQLDSIHASFTDPEVTSVRLVLNPETVVIKESQRTLTYLHLFGYSVDAVILNRLLPPEVEGGYFAQMRRAQKSNQKLVQETFSPLPILEAPYFPLEVMGLEHLQQMGQSLYGERDPSDCIYTGKTFEVEAQPDGKFRLTLVLPLVQKDEVDLIHRGAEMTIVVGAYRRSFHLPRVLYRRDVERARIEDGRLVILFSEKK
ncbi:MAG: ArsA family ATPase [Candidatus Krumholzibacteriia bacterium]